MFQNWTPCQPFDSAWRLGGIAHVDVSPTVLHVFVVLISPPELALLIEFHGVILESGSRNFWLLEMLPVLGQKANEVVLDKLDITSILT